jgi:hypothetical protein
MDQIATDSSLTEEEKIAQSMEIHNILLQRQAFRDALQLAKDIVGRATLSTGERSAAEMILQGYGTENDGNDVVVARRTDSGSGVAFTREEGGKRIVAISPSELANSGDLWTTIFHEGVHVAQSRIHGFAARFGFNANPSIASAERHAYTATATLVAGIDSAFVRAGMADAGPRSFSVGNPPIVLWNRGWTEVDMRNGVQNHVRRLGYLDSAGRETATGARGAYPGGGANKWE